MTAISRRLIKSRVVFCLEHDDVIKWKHFPRYWPFVRGIHRGPVNSPHKGQWRGALMFSLIRACINTWVNSGEAGDLKRRCAHYYVNVMENTFFRSMVVNMCFLSKPLMNEHGSKQKSYQNSLVKPYGCSICMFISSPWLRISQLHSSLISCYPCVQVIIYIRYIFLQPFKIKRTSTVSPWLIFMSPSLVCYIENYIWNSDCYRPAKLTVIEGGLRATVCRAF